MEWVSVFYKRDSMYVHAVPIVVGWMSKVVSVHHKEEEKKANFTPGDFEEKATKAKHMEVKKNCVCIKTEMEGQKYILYKRTLLHKRGDGARKSLERCCHCTLLSRRPLYRVPVVCVASCWLLTLIASDEEWWKEKSCCRRHKLYLAAFFPD